jgi:hypothetical protein
LKMKGTMIILTTFFLFFPLLHSYKYMLSYQTPLTNGRRCQNLEIAREVSLRRQLSETPHIPIPSPMDTYRMSLSRYPLSTKSISSMFGYFLGDALAQIICFKVRMRNDAKLYLLFVIRLCNRENSAF